MLKLCLAAALEVLHTTVGREPYQVTNLITRILQIVSQSFCLCVVFSLFLNLNIAKFPCGVPEANWVLNS